MIDATPREKAYLAPFFAFFLPPLLSALINHFLDGQAHWMIAHPEYWIHPAQILLCGAVLAHYWPFYHFRLPARPLFVLAIGILALLLWVGPQLLVRSYFNPLNGVLHSWAAPRTHGFDPAFFASDGWLFYLNLSLRFLRLVIIVPLVEEIFWRGFLLRYVIRNDFLSVPIGAFQWGSCVIVALGFMGEHLPLDYPAALATGLLFNAVAYRTKNLMSCVITHAITNLLLGIYVLKTNELGFW